MNMRKSTLLYENVVLSSIFAVFTFLLYIARTSPSYSSGGDTASMTFPSWIFIITMSICALKLILNYFCMKKENNDNNTANKIQKTHIKVYITLLSIIIYALCWNMVGFSISTIIFVAFVSQMLRPSCPMPKTIIIALGVAVFMNIVFGMFFKVDFPEPLLEYFIY